MNHIIGKTEITDGAKAEMNEKTEEAPKTEDAEKAEEAGKAEKTEAGNAETTEGKAVRERRRGTALRIGAFLTAAICFLAGVRAIKYPETGDGTVLNAISSQTAKMSDEGNGTKDSSQTGNTVSAGSEIQTTAVSEQNTAPITSNASSAAQSSATIAANASLVGTLTPISKTRTQEELAEAFASIPLSNEAELAYDAETLSTLIPAFQITDKSEPLVLIMHTHGSEAYADTDGHSQDIKRNVVAVGDALEETLAEWGIPVLHDKRMYDVPSYTRSYNEAYKGIRDILERNPSIQIVMDVHRDAYTYEDGSMLRTADTLTDAAGEALRTARVMFLVGTNAGTLEHPTWRSHLAFAMALQTRMEDIVPGITRSVFLRRQRFNEHLTPGSLLVEVGASGDTLEEAKTAVRIFGRALAEQIRSEKG